MPQVPRGRLNLDLRHHTQIGRNLGVVQVRTALTQRPPSLPPIILSLFVYSLWHAAAHVLSLGSMPEAETNLPYEKLDATGFLLMLLGQR